MTENRQQETEQTLPNRLDRIVIRKEYIKKLISVIKEQIAKDPDAIEACKNWGCDCTIPRWINVELLCMVIEEEILNNNDV